jgi:hypothetical protein
MPVIPTRGRLRPENHEFKEREEEEKDYLVLLIQIDLLLY